MLTLTIGTKLGRYEIRSKLGEGGMGEVYLVQDTKLDRTVAVKVLPTDLASNQKRMRRFVQEAHSARARSPLFPILVLVTKRPIIELCLKRLQS